MADDDAESLRSAPEEQPREHNPARGKRQRAADLFSPHRYRELQVKAFERKAGRATEPEPVVPGDDDAIDPPLYSDAPAAEAARAPAEGIERHESFDMLSPVDASDEFDFPFDPSAAAGDAELDADEFELGADEFDDDVPADAAQAGHDGLTLPSDEFEQPLLDAGTSESSQTGSAQFESSDLATAQLATYPPPPYADLEDSFQRGDLEASDERQDQASPKIPRSAGRDMPAATTVGLTLLALTVGAAYFHKLAFAVLLYIFAAGAVIEWKRALERHGRRIPIVPLIAATAGLGVATYYGKAEGLVVALLVGCAGVVAWRIGDERIENTLADSLAGVLTLLWIPFLASFLFLLELADDGWQRVIIVVLAVVGNDTGALVAGVRFGRHKLLPRVSPAKTWEGAIGGVLVGTAAASVAAYFFFDGKWYIGAAVGFASAVAAAIGDLAESTLKRDIQVKDMSSVLPGHGGILDRIDSLLFAAPVGYVVFAVFLGTLGGGGL